MIIKKSDIEAVAVKKSQYPEPDLKEIAFAGRSNVGKSSLLNLLTGRKSLARVSGAPGKTRTINFYRINDEFRLVDLPGTLCQSVKVDIPGLGINDGDISRKKRKSAQSSAARRYSPCAVRAGCADV